MNGMNANTGTAMSGKAHLNQSVRDILTTPIGSRVMRRHYGSHLFDLIDQAANDVGRLRLMAATADALTRWEPRLELHKVLVSTNFGGDTTIHISGRYNGAETDIDVPLGVAS